MNDKTAKRLRRIARRWSGAKPTTYQIVMVPKSTAHIGRGSRLVYVPPVVADGQVILRGAYERVWPMTAKQARLKGDCERKIYKDLKAGVYAEC